MIKNLLLILLLLSCSNNINKKKYNESLIEKAQLKSVEKKEDDDKICLLGKNKVWVQKLEFNFLDSKDSLEFSLLTTKNGKENSKITGIAILGEESELGTESIADDETFEMISVKKYFFNYKNCTIAICLHRGNYKTGQFKKFGECNIKFDELINFNQTLRECSSLSY